MEQIKLLSMTGVLTILIWITADSLVNETLSVGVTFDVMPAVGAGDMLVSPISAHEVFELQVSGPRKSVARLQSAGPLVIPVRLSNRAAGTERLALKDALDEQWHDYPRLRVDAVSPPEISVLIDHMVSVPLSLVLKDLTLDYDVRPQLKPSVVSVRLRASTLSADGKLPPHNITSEVERHLRELPAGKSATIGITLDASSLGMDAALTPSMIEVSATVSASRITVDVPTVPILISVTFSNLGGKQLEAVPRDGTAFVVQTIRVTGPTDAVDRLLRRETHAYGLIRLKEDDLVPWTDYRSITPEFLLPPGIELATPAEPVEFRLTRRAGGEPE